MQSTYVLKIGVPRSVRMGGRAVEREGFYDWLWQELGGARGLQGVHEGTLLSEQAAEAGLETDSWTLDSAEAPRERDWVAGQVLEHAELYFETQKQARAASTRLSDLRDLQIGSIREQKNEDWDAQWKASFLGNAGGVPVPPFWRILPPWVSAAEAGLTGDEVALKINPGAGFGTGTHETTQLCLQAIGEAAVRSGTDRADQGRGLAGACVLDFGSGSGILSIGAALAGGRVIGVEIDELAIDNAVENAALNGVQVEFSRYLDSAPGPYSLVIANILKPVLLEFAPELVRRMAPGAGLILSGLIDKDVADVQARYTELLGRTATVRERGEWRALVWA